MRYRYCLSLSRSFSELLSSSAALCGAADRFHFQERRESARLVVAASSAQRGVSATSAPPICCHRSRIGFRPATDRPTDHGAAAGHTADGCAGGQRGGGQSHSVAFPGDDDDVGQWEGGCGRRSANGREARSDQTKNPGQSERRRGRSLDRRPPRRTAVAAAATASTHSSP